MSTIIIIHPSEPTPTRVRLGHPGEPWAFTLPGDRLTLSADGPRITAVDVVAAPDGDEPTIDPEGLPLVGVTLATVGRHHLRVTVETGETADVSIITCEPGALERLPERQRSGGDAVDKRRVLRELARYDQTFTGLASQLSSKNLQPYGGA